MTRLTALVCTRNRGDRVVATLQSLLASTHPDFELLLVDQSGDGATAAAVAPLLADARLRYLPSRTRGKGRALNIGLQEAQGEIVAITDDDVVVPTGWLAALDAAFGEPRVAVVFGPVDPAPHDPQAGFIPTYAVNQTRLQRTIRDGRHGIGIGAAMALRRSAILALGGFDESFGPGGHWGTGEDVDMGVRALLHGWWLREIPAPAVIHDGFRSWAQFQGLTRRDGTAMGARCAKYLKTGHLSAALLMFFLGARNGLWRPLSNLFDRRRPQGFKRFVFFVHGFLRGMRTPTRRRDIKYTTGGANETPLQPPSRLAVE